MAIETIQVNTGEEQEVILPYGDISLRLVLQFDDYEGQWFCNIVNETTNITIINGLYLKLENNALFGQGLDFGLLGITDTDPDNPDAINLKADFGDRVKLIRDFDA